MGTRIRAHKLTLFIIPLIFTSHVFNVVQSSKVWDEVPFPEDLEENKRPGGFVDDEEYYDPSGDISGEEDGSTPEPSTVEPGIPITIYYRALVNFTNSFQYGPELDDIYSPAFIEISSAVVDTLESDYNRIPGQQTVNVVLIKKIDKDVFVELDVGSDNNSNETQISDVLFSVVKDGTIASYDTSVIGFQFRRLGEVIPSARDCLSDEFRCQDGLACIPVEYVCDKRPDCSDLSDEMNCGEPFLTPPEPRVPVRPTPPTPPKTRPPPGPGPCRADQATCQNGQCISRDYVCDGETDCTDGSDEFSCGRTNSPCEPNEFKCQNGRCALKLWRCDGDNDCQDNSDEMNCPTKRPGDTCAPEQFVCLSDRTCIPASYQCDEEPDCADRSDEYGCAPPTVTVPPEESITAARGDTVTFTCSAIGVPVPIITWRLNWGHLPTNSRITMSNENGRGTITIRDVKEGDQGAYTCEAINAKGLVFAIPDGVLTGNCRDGHFSVGGHCMPCFCFGITKNCQSTGRYRSQITLRFTEEDDFKGVNVSLPNHLSTPPHLSNTQMLINPESEEFQLVDLSRHFLDQDTYWSLPRQFLGNKVDSYGGYLKFKVSYSLQRDGSQPKEKPDVVLSGNGQKYIYRRGDPTLPDTINHREIKFTEENWQHSSGRAVTRDDLMMTLANLESIHIRTIYDNRMASVGLSDISMDTTSKEFTLQENPRDVEECRCPAGYSGLSCESCFPGFERAPGPYLGICAGCYCNGHASACDPISGHCLSCQHNTEGPQCDKCKPGFFGDPSRGRYDDCKPCPCPYTETSRRLSDTCFLDHDNQATCDACRPGYTGRRCEKCAPGYDGNPIQPNGKCVPAASLISKCDNRGTINPISKPCYCKANVVGALCDECKNGAFNLAADNPEGCMQCFCMGVTKQCASSTWSRDQVTTSSNLVILFTLSNAANTRTISEGITQRASSEVVYRSFTSIPTDIYYWVLPQNFRGDKVTTYGGELQYSMHYEPQARSLVIDRRPDVVLQGSSIVLEHYSLTKPLPRVPATITVPFRESAWRRSDGQPCTREHLLMALADISVFMIRATYADNMAESSISNLQMDIAVPHSTGNERALEVEECACPQGYTGPSCQDCDVGYTRTPGLYLGTCEKCDCHGYASGCDLETGECLNCLHNTVGSRCENCLPGFYGNPRTGDPQACRPCPCTFTLPSSCYLDSDGQPTCECPAGYTGRRFEGSTCSTCKQGTFYLSPANKDGCLSCFCMGVTQQCSSSRHYRDVISTIFAPGNYQGFALVNRQRTNRIDSGFSVELSTDGTQLSYTNFNYLGQEPHYWQLPSAYQGDKVGAYGGKLKYTISYVPGPRGSPIEDADVQIIGNDITLVARQPWRRGHGARESQDFEIVFREEHWQRPDGMPATREHLMMVLADLDDILIRASHHSEMRSSSISGVHMDIAVPEYTGLAQALEVEQCQCPPGYHGLSCQDCSPGYTRTGGGLYLGHCELCECNGHTDSCHPETGICTNCQHNTKGELCEQCADGFFGDPTAGTPEDCQACACPGTDPDNQFSRTCESLGNGDYQCTACQPGYTGQYCEHCAPGYVGNPQARIPFAASLVVKVYPERVQVAQGIPVTLRCQVSGYPPHYFRWSREDGRPISSTAERRRQGTELHFPSVQPSDAGIYICTCRDQRSSNRSKAEIVVTTLPSKPIEVFIEEPKRQSINVGSTVSFICTAKSKLPAYTLVWTRNGIGKLPNRAMDFNGILTIQNVQPEDAGIYVCTGSNMLGMDEGTARLHVPVSACPSFTEPVATVNPPVLTVKQGQRAEFRCTVTGNPTPAVEWIGGPGKRIGSKAVIRNGLLTIPSVDHVDDGEYICKALNTHGEHTARGVLHVQSTSQPHGLPHVQVSPPRVEIHEGETLRLYCRAVGSPTPALTWKKRGGSLPPQARLERTDIGTLFVPNIRSSDAGTYLCVGTNTVGSSEAHIEVFVKRGEAREIIPSGVTIQPSIASVMEGETLDLNCIVPGTSPASVKWSRAGGLLSSNHQVLGTQLRILQASADDTGEYICQVEGGPFPRQASVSVSVTSSSSRKSPRLMRINATSCLRKITLDLAAWLSSKIISPASPSLYECNVYILNTNTQPYCLSKNSRQFSIFMLGLQSPIISIEPHSTAVKLGELASFRCRVHSGAQPVRLEWKPTNNLPLPDNVKIGPDNSVMTITNAQARNQGTYRCVASNLFGMTHSIASLIVREIIIIAISIGCVSFCVQILVARPEDSGTYVCTAQNNQGITETRVEVFVEGGPQVPTVPRASVREPMIVVVEGSTTTLRCDAHGFPKPTITWSKERSSLPWRHKIVDNSLILTNVGRQDSGQYVCNATNHMGTSEVTIMLEVDTPPYATSLPDDVSVRVGEVIRLQCLAHGTPPLRFEWTKVNGSLPPSAQQQGGDLQINLAKESDAGTYKCVASNKVGKSEAQARVSVRSPLSVKVSPQVEVKALGSAVEFTCAAKGGSHIEIEWLKEGGVLPPNHHIKDEVLSSKVVCVFQNGGICEDSTASLYKCSCQRGYTGSNSKYAFFSVLSGQAVLRSQEPMSLGQWHRVVAERLNKDGSLKVDHAREITRSSPGKAQGLNIHTPMYLGGVPSMDILPKPANVSMLFDGCIGEVFINGKKLDLSYSFIESRAISQCKDGNPCDRRPCLHGGTCMASAEYEYQCLCAEGYEGDRCEIVRESCRFSSQCQNGGSCVNNHCVCPAGYTGRHCEKVIMCSCSSDSYQLGSGEAHILSREPVNDGQWHMITAVRTGKQGYLQIDGGSVQRGQSEGKSIMVNTKGNIYLGGAPDMKALTGGKYSSGITGCVKNLSLMNARPGEQPARPIDLQVHAEEGINVERCLT
uniref:Heparan sulfate proteoglycan 2 n=1 Tax=Sinocyclocheilus grahami TaxID=75366 RepID=A0A672LFC0_SINGR